MIRAGGNGLLPIGSRVVLAPEGVRGTVVDHLDYGVDYCRYNLIKFDGRNEPVRWVENNPSIVQLSAIDALAELGERSARPRR